jgi:TRAP-type C4-dicarboxylate transport system permease small subunit
MFERLLDRAVAASLVVSGALLVAIAAFVLFEVLIRAVLNTSTYVMVEFVGYALAPMVTFAMAASMQNGQLIRVNLLAASLPSKARRFLEMFCVLASIALTLWLAHLLWQDVAFNWRRGAVSDSVARFPLWITPAVSMIGLLIFIAALVAYLVRLVRGGEPIVEAGAADTAGT